MMTIKTINMPIRLKFSKPHYVDKDACNFVLKHETCHIKNNDCFTIPLVPAICSLAAAIFSTFLLPVIPALLITICVGMIAEAKFSQYREGKADRSSNS